MNTNSGSAVKVIDASNLILGRLASYAAKQLLLGAKIVIINSEKSVISGSKQNISEKFKKRLQLRTLGSQKKAPKHPHRPDNFVRRTIRGMLPWKKPKGKTAYRRLRVYIGVPHAYPLTNIETLPEAKKSLRPSITVGELLETYGWKQVAS